MINWGSVTFRLFAIMITTVLILLPFQSLAVQKMNETELGEMTGQTGATFILENFDFFISSPGVTYLESSGGADDDERDFISLNNINVHDGFMGPIELSTNLDWDIFSLPIDDVEYNFARFHLYNTAKTPMDINIDSLSIQATNTIGTPVPALVELPGIEIDNLKFNAFTLFLGGASNNIGQAFEIDLNLTIDSATLGFAEYGVNSGSPVVLDDIRIAGSFTGSEPDYDKSLMVAYSEGLWSEDGASIQAGDDAAYEEALLASCRWVPDPGSWVGSGVLKLGDVEHGNPIRMDIVYDDNYYIPFKYNITSGNEMEEPGGAQYYGPASDQYTSDSRGWKDGIDNYSTTETPTQMYNPRYGKTYISQDLPIIGSVRIGSEGGDIIVLDGINLQIHAEIPGYGYGNTPNSIPRPFYHGRAPLYDINPGDTNWVSPN